MTMAIIITKPIRSFRRKKIQYIKLHDTLADIVPGTKVIIVRLHFHLKNRTAQ